MVKSNYEKWLDSLVERTDQDEFMYQHCVLDAKDMLIIADLLWPKFERINGMIIRSRVVSKYRQDIESCKPVPDTEKSFNRIELWYEFSNPCSDQTYDALINLMKESWEAALKRQFPDVEMVVEISHELDYDGPDVTAYQRDLKYWPSRWNE